MENSPEKFIDQAKVLSGKCKYSAAVKCLEQGVTLYPDNIDILIKLAELYDIKDRYDESILTYQKVIKLQPDSVNSYLEIANIFFYIKREYDEAEKYYKEVIKLAPDNIKAYLTLTDLYLRRHKSDDIISLLTDAQRNLKLDAPLLANLGKAYALKGSTDEAIKAFEASIEENKGYVASYILLSEIYFKLEEYEKVVKLSSFVVDICPDVEDARILLDKAHSMLSAR